MNTKLFLSVLFAVIASICAGEIGAAVDSLGLVITLSILSAIPAIFIIWRS